MPVLSLQVSLGEHLALCRVVTAGESQISPVLTCFAAGNLEGLQSMTRSRGVSTHRGREYSPSSSSLVSLCVLLFGRQIIASVTVLLFIWLSLGGGSTQVEHESLFVTLSGFHSGSTTASCPHSPVCSS